MVHDTKEKERHYMKTKDYIYLDDDLLNSHLAQFEKGLLIRETIEHGTESSDSINGSAKTTIGVNGIFGLGAKLQNEITDGDNSMESEFTKNMVENVLNDYAVDLLIKDCTENNLIQDLKSSSEGNFLSFSSEFRIYDFEYLKRISNSQTVKPLLERDTPPVNPGSQSSRKERTEYLKQKQLYDKNTNKRKNAEDGYKMINDFSVLADALFEESVLIKLDGSLAICKRSKLRLSKAQISFENESNRKLKIFGVVSAIKAAVHPQGIYEPFNPNDLDKVPSILFDIILSNFDMLHNNDKIIKPIAIYFEAD